MGTLRAVSAISGTLDGISINPSGSSNVYVSGFSEDTYNLTTSYKVATIPTNAQVRKALIVNTGATEVKVRVKVDAALWRYVVIPAGRFIEYFDTSGGGITPSTILEIAIRSVLSTGRVIVHQAWI